ncbi:MAG: tetratricopeptide repeat protein [Alphaproteobacteria bacterium]|nr:tetratricopeptide repeat protein [Alphaproteobacteria bacterium]
MTPSEAEAALRAVGTTADEAIDIAAAALAFAVLDRPEAGAVRYEEHLRLLAEAVATETAGHANWVERQAASLRAVLVDSHGYDGDRETYDDLRNADLSQVIDRRRGLPVALAILWLHTGRAQGWTMAGLNFPGHFLIRLDGPGESLILDPFNAGRTIGTPELRALLKSFAGEKAALEPEHVAPLSNRATLLRLQNNIKIRLLNAEEPAKALPVIERMLLIAPGDAVLWREAGLVHRRLENLRSAIRCLETAHGLAEAPAARHRIAAEIAALRGTLN